MSIDKNYYVIAGYDLTNYKTCKYENWKWTDAGEAYLCNQRSGKVQLFDDPVSGSHLYLGFIFAAGDQWYFETEKFDMIEFQNVFEDVERDLEYLIRVGVISIDTQHLPKYQIIAFEECS